MMERIKKLPEYQSWRYADGAFDCIRQEPVLRVDGLTDHEKFSLYVYAWNEIDICPRRKSVMDFFGWTKYKVQKLFREIPEIEVCATFDDNTGLISGKGYNTKTI